MLLTGQEGRIERWSIADEAQERLIRAIASGRLPRGQRIVEADVAQEFGVSRVPVREAILKLGSLGILESAPGRGWQVADFDERHLSETYQVRLALETTMLKTVLLRAKAEPSLLDPLRDSIRRMEREVALGDAAAVNRADIDFHRTALTIADNRLAMRMWEGLAHHVMIIFGLESYRIPLDSIVAQHEQLLKVLMSGDEAELTDELADHITGYRSKVLSQAGLPTD